MIPVNLWKQNRARPVRPGKGVYWKKSDGLVQLAEIGTFYPVYVGTAAADYDTALSNPNRVLL